MSSRDRQKRAARAQQAFERQAAAKRQRWQRLTTIGSVAGLLLLMAGGYWGVTAVTSQGGLEGLGGPPAGAAGDRCVWIEFFEHASGGGFGGEFTGAPEEPAREYAGQGGELAAAHPEVEYMVDVGNPPEQVPRAGRQLMRVETNLGDIEVEMDLAAAPCTAASFSHLASAAFYDGTYCHRMFPGMLQCGDPNALDPGYRDQPGIGTGGPSYEFPDENLPDTRRPVYYPAGTVAMANAGAPDTNGSQFFFIYQDLDLDGPRYSVVGEIVSGMDVFEVVDANGHDASFATNAGGGRPNQDVIIERLLVDAPQVPPGPTGSPGSSGPPATGGTSTP